MTTADEREVQVELLDDQVAQESRVEGLPLSESRWLLESGVAYSACDGIEMVAVWVDGRVAVKMAADGYYFCDTYIDDLPGVNGLEDFVDAWTPVDLMERVEEELQAMGLLDEPDHPPEPAAKRGFVDGLIQASIVTWTMLFYSGKATVFLCRVAWRILVPLCIISWRILDEAFRLVDVLLEAWSRQDQRRPRRSGRSRKRQPRQVEWDIWAGWDDFAPRHRRRRLTKAEKQQMYRQQRGVCRGCRRTFEEQNLTGDHKVPLAHGGTNDISNFQLLCGSCNSTKGTGTQRDMKRRLRDRGVL